MKIKRYFGADMREALRKVRDDLGADAVILSTQGVAQGIEVMAALDYDAAALSAQTAAAPPSAEAPRPRPQAGIEWAQDPALGALRDELHALRGLVEDQLGPIAFGALARRAPRRASLIRRLAATGLTPALCGQFADGVSGDLDDEQCFQAALGALAGCIPCGDDDLLQHGGVVALVGPTGVGKTTTIAKLAARYALSHGTRQVALISTDNYRIGAHEQLMTFGRILGVPVQRAQDAQELRALLDAHSNRALVLIDTAGMGPRDVRLVEQLATLEGVALKTLLVLSATVQHGALTDAVRAFARVPLAGVVLTKLDEAARLGDALACVIESQLPLLYVSEGQRVPEDLAPARAHQLAQQAGACREHPALLEPDLLRLAYETCDESTPPRVRAATTDETELLHA
jgi:flagellar biosynthesis protein FlhF